MEAILPFKIKNEQKFFESALKVGYDEMAIYKFIYIMQLSDMDIFPKMHDERINILVYGWEVCEDYKQKLDPNEWELPEEMETMLKLLVPWSLDIWFSKEWDKCKYHLKCALIHCLNRARDLLMRMPDMMQINWDFLLLYNLKTWNVSYLKNLNVTKEKTLEDGAQSIETEELPATADDIAYVKLEQLPVIVLRLIKLFDQSSIDMVKTMCMRVIAAWNKIHQTELETSGSRRPYIPPEDKRCLMLICHIYLMAVYESDDVKGYVIDNMINNIRFYYQGFQNSTPLHAMDDLEYTPARYIALTNIHLRVQKRDFFDFFIWNKYDTSLVNLFGVVSQAYKSYLLGNLLMELNNMNEDDLNSNIPLYKRLMNSYVNEREKSELFLINELSKTEAQRYAHNIIQTVKNVTDFKSKICKGNRMSNIGNYENSDDTVAPLADLKIENSNSEDVLCEDEKKVDSEEMEDELERIRIKESELRSDPIFQNLPNNEGILYYVYDVLARKDYNGWHFAKIVLLVKIIDREQNMIETWRYHPGLTTDFMLNLEIKLSDHYVDLAKIFKDHPFLEQEFWLTAFYLNPTTEIFETIKRLGMRNNRKRTEEHSKLVMNIDNIEAKYGLLSSTIDVKDLASMSNTDDPTVDYDPLFSVLHSLRLPDSLVKDMLTAIFLPRNRSFAWSVDWVILRNRCKMIMTSSKEKKRFVDLNMAEANERLKYLIIDYEKYKNRPQLDYGTIEEGYENLMTVGEFDKESEEEEEEEEDFEDDEDVYESKKRIRGGSSAAARKKEEEKAEEDNSQEDDPFLMGKRRTRARTAATLASFLFQTLPRSTRRKRNQKPPEEETKADEDKIAVDNDDKSSDSKSPITTSESPIQSPLRLSCDQKDSQLLYVSTKPLKECLKERPTYLNTTQGFQNLIDIWNVERSELQLIDENCVSLIESSCALQIAAKLKLLNKDINPLGSDENEYIDDTEMIIHNSEFVRKKECGLNTVELEDLSGIKYTSTRFAEPTVATDDHITGKTVQSDRIKDTNIDTTINESIAFNLLISEESIDIKEIEIGKTDHIPELPLAELNVAETKNWEMSIVAEKSGVEVSATNAEGLQTNAMNMVTSADVLHTFEKDFLKLRNREKEITNAEETRLKSQNPISNLENLESKCIDENMLVIDKALESLQESVQSAEFTVQKDSYLLIEIKSDKATEGLKKSFETIIEGCKTESMGMEDKTNAETETNLITIDKENEEKELASNSIQMDNSESKQSSVDLVETEYSELEVNSVGENAKHSIETYNSELTPNATNTVEKDNDSELNSIMADLIETGHIASDPDALNSVASNISESKPTSVDSVKSYNSELRLIAVDSIATEKSDLNSIGTKATDNESGLYSLDLGGTNNDNNCESNRIEDSIEIDNSELKLIAVDLMEIYNATSNSFAGESVQNDNSELKLTAVDTAEVADAKTKSVAAFSTDKYESISAAVDSIKRYNNSESKPIEMESTAADISELISITSASIEKENETKPIVRDEVEVDNTESRSVTVDSTEAHNTESKRVSTEMNKSSTETSHNASSSDLYYSTSDILDKSQTIVEKKLEGTEFNKEILGTTDQAKVETNECEKATEILSEQRELEIVDCVKHSPSQLSFSEDDSENSLIGIECQESSDFETQQLKNLCLIKTATVSLRKLTPSDLINLRQPKIKLHRMSYERYTVEFRAKRRCIEGKVYLEFDDSSNSNNSYWTNTSSSEAYHPTKLLKRKLAVRKYSARQLRTSESENDSNNSDDFKLSTIIARSRKRLISTPSTSQSSTSQHVTGPKSARKSGPKSARRGRPPGPKSSKHNLIVTPRSASGLKLRISQAEENQQSAGVRSKRSSSVVYDEIIQLSSSSSDIIELNNLTTIAEEVIEDEAHPLFEEEIII